tara:strand:+ start:596 stop:1417 length:822 start_codon:yes stop_codon:yes gene_type:complete
MSEQINLDTDLLASLENIEKRKYYLARRCPELDHIAAGGASNDVDIMWNMYGVVVFSIKEQWVREIGRLTKSYEEITEDVGRWGVKHFGEIRAEVKVTDEDPLSTSEEYKVSQSGPKTKIVLPKERIDAAITFMKLSAKLIIEDEYDRKFLSLKAEDSKLEQYFWDSQITEANNLEGQTPILNSIATAKGLKTSEVAESVLAGKKTFDEKALALYDAMVALKQKFTNCATIKELNVLWETYLGVPMPQSQAIELGNVEEDGWTPLPIKSGLQF